MSQLEELTDIVQRLAVTVRENRDEIAALRSRVRELESRGNVYGPKSPKCNRVGDGTITIDINSKTRQF